MASFILRLESNSLEWLLHLASVQTFVVVDVIVKVRAD